MIDTIKTTVVCLFEAVGITFVMFAVCTGLSYIINEKYWTRQLRIAKYKAFFEYMQENTRHCKNCELYGKCKLQPRGRISYGWRCDSIDLEVYGCPFFVGEWYDEQDGWTKTYKQKYIDRDIEKGGDIL